jgi:GT2 family glycosyltransferase/tetratricopeptide (TPR) repeat protein/SAM-dependent methyltransferase
MSEIFRQERPSTPLEFTGERFTSATSGQIEYEHLHRYLLARSLARGKDVLDVASGEGYGAALLSQVARSVVGIEVDSATVEHATKSYQRRNLRYVAGDARSLPIATATIDIVTSFETLEHFREHELFLAEVARVLRPGGMLVISTPDRDVYSPVGEPANPYHVRELSRREFCEALQKAFGYVELFCQRTIDGSVLMRADPADKGSSGGLITFERRDPEFMEESRGLPRAKYLIACASNQPLSADLATASLYINTSELDRAAHALAVARSELASVRSALDAQQALEQRWANDLDSLNRELATTRLRVTQQDDELSELRARERQLWDDHNQAAAQLSVAHSEVAQRDAALSELRGAEQKLRDEHKRVVDELALAQAEIAQGNVVLPELRRVEQKLRDDHERALAELALARADIAQRDILLSELRANEQALQSEHQQALQSERQRVAEQLSTARVGMQQRDTALTDLRKVERHLREELQRTASELDAAQAQNSAQKEQISLLQDTVGLRKFEIGNLQNTVEFHDRFLEWHRDNDGFLLLGGKHLFAAARRAARQKNWKRAEYLYRKVLKVRPSLGPIWVQYGHCVKEQGDLITALGAYRQAVWVDPTSEDAFIHLGHVEKRLGMKDAAITSLQRAFLLAPSRSDVRQDLIELGSDPGTLIDSLLDSHCPPQQVGAARRGRGLRYSSALRRANAASRSRQWDVASKHYRRALRLAPADADIWAGLGHSLLEAGDHSDAEGAFLQALVLEPGNRALRRQVGDVVRDRRRGLGHATEAAAGDGERKLPAQPAQAGDLALIPFQHLQHLEGDRFLTTGDDAQFGLENPGGMLPRGWTLIAVETKDADPLLRPILYAWGEDSGDRVFTYELPVVAGAGTSQALIQLPARTSAMRLDPTDESGVHVAISRVSFSDPLQTTRSFVPLESDVRAMEYNRWVQLYDTLHPEDRDAILRHIGRLMNRPLLSVVMPVYNPAPRCLRHALDSVTRQLYPDWELCIADDASTNPEIRTVLEEYAARDPRIKVVFRKENGHISAASNSALQLVAGDFVVLMDHDDELPPHALYMVAAEIDAHPDTDIIYTDEDKIDMEGLRHDPHFKTDWNAELFYSQNMVAHMGVYRTSLVRKIGGFRVGFEGSQDYDFMLRALRFTQACRIRHIPFVLYHWRIATGVRTFSTDNPSKSINTAHRALVEHFQENKQEVEVVPIESYPSWWRIKRPLPDPCPSVTLIIPTRDRVGLLSRCVDGLLNRTTYLNFDIIVVDNESADPETLAYFAKIATEPRVQVLRVEGPFNFSALNNAAVRHATGQLIGFVNNDIEVINPDWLEEMVSQAIVPGVGAVGAKLLYADGTIQHAGVTLGVYGIACHGHRGFARDAIGYFGRPQLLQEVSAVTAAMLIMPKGVFDEIGGFDEINLAVGYNDVDLCLRIREAGYRVVYTPFAELYHLESASRGPDSTPEMQARYHRERAYMTQRWGALLQHDPFYSENLSLADESFRFAFPPRVTKPWLNEPIADRWSRVQQLRFDRECITDLALARDVAAQTAVVVVACTPFRILTSLMRTILAGTFLPARIVVVDTSPGGDSGRAAALFEPLRHRHPSVDIEVIRDDGQDVSLSRACNLGVQAACDATYLAVVTETCTFATGSFDYLLKAFCSFAGRAVVAPRVFLPSGRIEGATTLLDPAFQRVVTAAANFEALPKPGSYTPDEISVLPVVKPEPVLCGGIVLGRRDALCAPDGTLFDELFYLVGREEDLSRRLQANQVPIVVTSASAVTLDGERPRDAPHLWEFVHDYAWINRKWNGEPDDGQIEFICPFHRGDVLIGIQVAALAGRLGRKIRFHVAQDLMSWVQDFAPDFAVEALPIPVPHADSTAPALCQAYMHVVRRLDASPRIARSHPQRGLDATERNLVETMLEAVGLPRHTRIDNFRPQSKRNAMAKDLLAPYGENVILLHASGGWQLKTIPGAVLDKLAAQIHRHGFKLIQIGGPNDEKLQQCDGWVTQNLSPAAWAPIFREAKALIGVDSWSAHFASILDIPQITLYGSTHPRHVNSKRFFAEQTQPSLVLGPAVDCSPCNSLKCLRAPVDHCIGFAFDPQILGRFLDALMDGPPYETTRFEPQYVSTRVAL